MVASNNAVVMAHQANGTEATTVRATDDTMPAPLDATRDHNHPQGQDPVHVPLAELDRDRCRHSVT